MGRVYNKVMENRKHIADVLLENIKNGSLLGNEIPETLATPENPITQRAYRGINRMNLILAGIERRYTDPRWMTFDQLKTEGYHLKKGSKGVLCEYWNFGKNGSEEDADVWEEQKAETPKVAYYYVFNASEVEGIEPYQVKDKNEGIQRSIRNFFRERLRETSSDTELQNVITLFLSEIEQGVFDREAYQINGGIKIPEERELFQIIRKAQLQSEVIISEYDRSLIEASEVIEVISTESDYKEEEQASVVPEEKNAEKIADFGRKIGGARKDQWKDHGLRVEDLEEMNDAEREKYITKNNIWKAPDYEKMLQEGTPRNVVWFIKKVHDKLRSKPLVLCQDLVQIKMSGSAC